MDDRTLTREQLLREVRRLRRRVKALERGGPAAAPEPLPDAIERYRLLVETMRDGLVILDAEDRIAFVNDAFCRMVGYTPEELLGRTPFDLHAQDTEQVFEEHLARRREGIEEPYEVHLDRKDGRRIWVRIAPRSLRDAEGRYEGAFAVITDITALKEAEAALQARQKYLDAIIRNSHDGIVVVDAEGRFEFPNEAFCRILERSPEDLVGRHFLEVVPPDQHESICERWAEVQRGEGAPYETDVLTAAGARKSLLVSHRHMDLGGTRKYCVVVKDVTERKRMERALRKARDDLERRVVERTRELARANEALRRSEEKFRVLAEQMNDIPYRTDGDAVLTYIGPQVRRYGFRPEDLVGRSPVDIALAEDRERVAGDLERTFSAGEEFPSEFRVLDALGRLRWFEDRGRLLRDATGRVTGMVGVLRDITERRNAEAALRRSEERWRRLIETMAEGVTFMDPQGRIVQANPAAERILGLPRSELLSRRGSGPPWEVLRPDGSPMPREEMAGPRAQREKRPVLGVETGVRRPDGSVVWLSVSAAPLLGPNGQLEGVVGTFTGVTPQRRALEALRTSEERYRTLVQNVNIGVYRNTGGPEGRFLEANPAIAEIFGYESVEEFRKVAVADLYQDPADRARFVEEVRRKGYVRGKELRLKKRDGTPIRASCTARATFDERGRIRWMDGVIEDITARKEAEAAVRRSERTERRLRELLAALHEVTLVLTEERSLDALCRRAVELGRSRLGFDRMGLRFAIEDGRAVRGSFGVDEKGRTRDERGERREIPPGSTEDRILRRERNCLIEQKAPELDAAGRQVVRGGERVVAGLWDGRRVIGYLSADNRLSGRPIDGMLRRVIVLYATTLGHLCTRVRVEQSLRESEERFALFMRHLPAAAAIKDENGRILYINEYLGERLGWNIPEIIGKTNPDIIPKNLLEGITAAEREALTTGRPVQREFAFEHHGTPIHLHTVRFPIVREGRPPLVGSVSWDVTDRKRAEERLAAYQRRLRHLASQVTLAEQRERRQIAGRLHDTVGQTLTLAQMRIGQLLERAADGPLAPLASDLRRTIHQAVREVRTLTVDLSPPILYELGIEAAVGWLAERFEERYGLHFRVTDDGRRKPLHDDVRVVLFRSVNELMFNVVKHARASYAEVSIERPDDRPAIRIRVLDDGEGFVVPRAWSEQGGNHFGLFSIDERLVSLGGRMKVESVPGRGTRVTLVAPLAEPAPQPEEDTQ